MNYTEELGKNAKAAEAAISSASASLKNSALAAISKALTENTGVIIAENAKDLQAAKENGMSEAMQDRLRLDEKRIMGMAKGVDELIALNDPVGEVIEGFTRPNGLKICKTRVPMGVIGIIFESRPNVTVDAAALCLKAGNAVILKGGKEAINSNICLGTIMRNAIEKAGLPADVIQVVENTSRETTNELMRLNGYLDVLIPRGSGRLIQAVVNTATVPVIETGTGICHVYVDKDADLDMALDILENAKCSRPSVCNAAEVCLVHRDTAPEFLPRLRERLVDRRAAQSLPPVELRLDGEAAGLIAGVPAGPADFDTEFLDYILAVKVVGGVDEAVGHIAAHSTGHSEAIVTANEEAARRFTALVDSAAVYWNASTRFTDGGVFGLGCEMGISTQRLHARGPMGLAELCAYKYVVRGSGQVR